MECTNCLSISGCNFQSQNSPDLPTKFRAPPVSCSAPMSQFSPPKELANSAKRVKKDGFGGGGARNALHILPRGLHEKERIGTRLLSLLQCQSDNRELFPRFPGCSATVLAPMAQWNFSPDCFATSVHVRRRPSPHCNVICYAL